MATRKRRKKKTARVGNRIAQVPMSWSKDTAYKTVFRHLGGKDLGLPYDNLYTLSEWVGAEQEIWVAVSLDGPIFTDEDFELDREASDE